jgi:hypothetical protein
LANLDQIFHEKSFVLVEIASFRSPKILPKFATEENTEGDYCNKVELLPITKHYLIMEHLSYFFWFLVLEIFMAMDAPRRSLQNIFELHRRNSNNKMQEKKELSKEKKTVDTPPFTSKPYIFFLGGFTLSKLKTYECINSSPIISNI